MREDEFERFIPDLVRVIRHRGWSDIFIFYDEANRLPLDFSTDFLTRKVEALNHAGVVTIYSASPEMAKKCDSWVPQRIEIGPFLKVEDMLRLLSRYCFGEKSLRDDLPVDETAIVRIWELSRHIPYLIQYLSGQSFSFAHKEGSRHVEEKHVLSAYQELSRKKPETFSD